MMIIARHQRRLVPRILNRFNRATINPRCFSSGDDPHADFREQMKDLQDEREMLFGFTEEETSAWQQKGPSLESSHVEALNKARQEEFEKPVEDSVAAPIESVEELQPFTHVSDSGTEVSMVDVGHKAVTQRVARAQTKVIFPPEVMTAFDMSVNNELVGPKGPIFATAKLAGIMAAKKTSDLIPLCHPLALDKVHVEISLKNNVAIIECECRVTSKTGVEMEALTGATVSALTIYDMVKAVSHRVQITGTMLLSKSGGKRTIEPEKE